MATIDRNQLLTDIKTWLPDGNVLTDAQITAVAEYVISDVGDDDTKYAEVLCKSLKAVALANLAKHTVDGSSLKQEKVGENSETYDTAISQNMWKNYISSLKDICPIFGYKPLTVGIGMKINPSDKIVVNDCDETTDLIL